MTQRSGGQILIDNLAAQGCDRIFTVPGESFLAALDTLHGHAQIQLVGCRQEGGAAYMAEADGKLTGRPGVAMVSRTPGASNAAIGVHVARQDSTPMLLLIGDIERKLRGRGAFQEADLTAMFTPLAKWSARIDDPERIPEYVARAYGTAMSGRPGPVVLILPEDVLTAQADTADRPKAIPPVQPACAMAAASLIGLLKDACAPIAIVGGGGWDAAAAFHFAQFAERIGMPVATAFRHQDAIASSSPVYAGNLGFGPNPKLAQRIRDADLLLVVGARLGEITTDDYTLVTPEHPDQLLAHVHPDPEELGSVFRTDLPICADMREFAELVAAWEDEVIAFSSGAEAHQEWLAWSTPTPRETGLDLAQVVGAMRDLLPADTILTNGAGNYSGWWHRYWRYGPFPSQLAPTNGSMGYGVPAAIAAALRCPDRQVVAITGDGDFMMTGQELATAVQHDAQMIVVLVDNGSHGTIRMHQERAYPGRVVATELCNPDFSALARAYGCWAESVETTDQFRPALERAVVQSGVRLLHLKTDVEFISHSQTLSSIRIEVLAPPASEV
jgi:acetolactate synthase-1/2/3 large subunit